MTAAWIAALIVAWVHGVLCVGALWSQRPARSFPLLLFAGLGVGLATTSLIFFAISLLVDAPLLVSTAAELFTGALAGWMWLRRGMQRNPSGDSPSSIQWSSAIPGLVFLTGCVVFIIVSLRIHQTEPHGISDGWTIWNLHARIIFRGGTDWPAIMQAPQLLWSHPDYPLLLPASVARAWTWAGAEPPFAAGAISSLFGVATIGTLVSALTLRRESTVGLLGGLVLLGTPFFITFSANQHADIPFGFFVLTTVAFVAVSQPATEGTGVFAVAGLSAGMAAWTKNEGMLFVVICMGWIGWHGIRKDRGILRSFGAGLCVSLLAVGYYKFQIAPPNDLVASDPLRKIGQLFDPSRHRVILASGARDFLRFGEWCIAPFVAMILALIGSKWTRVNAREAMSGSVVLLMLGGYYIVYLLSHWELAAHIDSSLVRLLLQLWPTAIFLWCLALPTVSPSSAVPSSSQKRLSPVFAAAIAGVVLVAAVNSLMSRQLAVNELARGRIDGIEVNAVVGDGWFLPERLGSDVWIWSKGESVLLLRNAGNRPIRITLSFSLSSLGSRDVTIQEGKTSRILWEGRVEAQRSQVTLAAVVMEPGLTTIAFKTNSPGMLESQNPGARSLTFGIFNPRIEE